MVKNPFKAQKKPVKKEKVVEAPKKVSKPRKSVVKKTLPPYIIDKNKGYWRHKVLIGTPTTGIVRYEWASARFGQIIPTNWSAVSANPYVPTYAPLEYLVADAQNLIVKFALESRVEWVFLIEEDNLLPMDCFLKMNKYMRDMNAPIVSGLYFTKSDPPEPMIYRGVGNSYYTDWKVGDKVWASGVPTGCLIIHSSLLRKLWDESPEYKVHDQVTRRVFDSPELVWYDPQTLTSQIRVGTSDLEFCRKIKEQNIFAKAGWSKYQKMEFPFLVDTDIFVKQIDQEGVIYPITMPSEFVPTPKPTKKPQK